MKAALRLIGCMGVILFGLAFALTVLSPIQVERAARTFIQSQIERHVRDQLAIVPVGAGETRARRLADVLAQRHEAEIEALREELATDLSTRIVAEVDRMQDLSCECRQRMLQRLNAAVLHVSRLERAETQLRRLVEGRYSEIVLELLRDVRIFTGSNLLAFLLLLALSFAKPRHVRQLFVPGLLLGVAALLASLIYLVGQNWFFTLLYGDFVGLTYGVWLLLIFGLLCDIALFKARITSRIVEAMLSAFTKAPLPC